MRRLLWAFVCVLSFSVASEAIALPHDVQAQGQDARSGVRGRVVDPTGGAIAGAHVTATSDRPGAPASTVTNQQGEFVLTVVAGTYTVRVSSHGFTDESRRVTVWKWRDTKLVPFSNVKARRGLSRGASSAPSALARVVFS